MVSVDRKEDSNKKGDHGKHHNDVAIEPALINFFNLLLLYQSFKPFQLLLMSLQSLKHLIPQLNRFLPDLLFLVVLVVDINSNLKHPLAILKLPRSLITHKMTLSVPICVPAQLELVRCKLCKEIWPYFCNLIEPVDLDDNFYSFIWRYLGGGRMHLVVRGIVGLYLELDDVRAAFVAQLEVPIDESIGDAATIIENDSLLKALPHESQVLLVVHVTIAVHRALKN